MPIHMHRLDGGRCLNIVLFETINKEDYKPLVAEFTRLTDLHGRICALIVVTRFHGWNASGLWEEFKFDLKNLNKLECLAIVGEARWQHAISSFVRPHTNAEVRTFDGAQLAEAQAWLANDEARTAKAA